MARNLNPIMAQFNDQPALIEEGRSAWLEACLNSVAAKSGEFEKMDARGNSEDFWFAPDDYRSYYRPYIVKDGILHVPVKGVLLNNFPYAYANWATGYEYIWEAIKRGIDDSAVKGIALVIDSGGGLVSGNYALVDKIYAVRGRKPIKSFASEYAYSAAYNIAAVGDDITVARTGGVGSIGVVVVHREYSKLLEAEGITTTILRSNPDKMEGNAYEVLSAGAQERIMERVNEFHSQFVATVARNRGMSEDAVSALTSRTYLPQQAIENGLADQIGNFDDAITAFVATINSEGDEQMADFTQAQLDAAVAAAVAETTAAATAATATATAEALAAGAAAERNRVAAIVGSDNAKLRPGAAIKLATNEKLASLDASAIDDLLADMPEEKKAAASATGGAPKGMLKAAMKGTEQPGITAGEGEEGDDDDEDEDGNSKAKAISKVSASLDITKGPAKASA